MYTPLTRQHLCCAFASILVCPLAAAAQTTSAPAERSTGERETAAAHQNVLRIYEVGDLILNVQDHPYDESFARNLGTSSRDRFGGGGGMGGGGVAVGGGTLSIGPSPSPGSSTQITWDALIDVLRSTVAPGSWAENGSGKGEVQPLGTALVVSQTPEVHTQIEALLNQIREGSSNRKTMTIDARWLMLNSDELDSLLLDDQDGVPQVEREKLAEFTRRPGSIRAITNCFSGQLVYLVSGTRRNVVSSYIPVVGSLELPDKGERLVAGRGTSPFRLVSESTGNAFGASGVGYQPIVEKTNFGALLEIRPTLMPGDNTAVVDLKSTLTVPGQRTSDSERGSQSTPLAPQVDRIAIEVQEFATTLRVPLGKPILVGGLTYGPSLPESRENAEPKSTAEHRQLYFVLEVR